MLMLKSISNSSNLNYISELNLSNGKIEVVLAFCTAHDIVFTSMLLNKKYAETVLAFCTHIWTCLCLNNRNIVILALEEKRKKQW